MRFWPRSKRASATTAESSSTSAEGAAAGAGGGEQRSTIENPAVPVTPEQLASLISYGPTRSGVQIDERTALTYTAVFAAVRILAESIGMLPTGIFEGDEDSQERTRATKHESYQLLRWRPNPEMTAAVFKETLQGQLCLWGDAYARIEHDNAGRVKALWPLMSARTRPLRIAGQLYYEDVKSGRRMAPEEVLHVPSMGFNGIQGHKYVELAREAIALGKAVELNGASFFGNGTNLSGILSTAAKLSPEKRAALMQAWKEAYSGLANASGMALLDGDLKWQATSTDPEKAQALQTRQFQILEVARLYRIPPHMLADLTKAGYASIEQMSLEFLIFTLGPWIEKWEQECTYKLCGLNSGFFVKFDERRLLRADLQARKEYYNTAVQAGWMNPNEVRGEEGMNPGGDELNTYRFPVNMVDAKNADKIASKAQTTAGDKADPTPTAAKRSNEDAAATAAATAAASAASAVTALRPVFVDAVTRMLNKESIAVRRNMTPEKAERFYTDHREHVFQALAAGTDALRSLTGAAGANSWKPVYRFAGERHADLPEDVTPVAERCADALISEILATHSTQPRST